MHKNESNFINQKIISYTGKNSAERLTENISFVNDQANSGFMDAIILLLSNISGIKKYIEIGGKYLFPLGFALNLLDWLLYTIAYIQSTNKNVGKTTNLLQKTLITPIIGIAIFGTAFVSATMATVIFSAVIGVDVVISLFKTIYYLANSIGKPEHEKEFYRTQAKENSIKMLVNGLFLTGIIVGMFIAAHIAFALVAAVSVIAAGVILAIGIASIAQRIKAKNIRKEWSIF